VILGTQTVLGAAAFADWGWRVPFIVSILLLAVSVYIRLSMNESPAFTKMKAEGKTSKAPLSESFGQWKNLKIVILALIGLTAGQAVVWYSGQFYALFFLTQALKVDAPTANVMVAISLVLGTPFFIVFGAWSDKIGRKPIIMAGCLLAVVTYFPVFTALTKAANPALARSIEHRFPYIDPLNHLQVELMRRYRAVAPEQRAEDPSMERVQRGIHLSINGIAAGLRNTG